MALVTNTIEATIASARKRLRNGSATTPPRIAATASPGMPAAEEVGKGRLAEGHARVGEPASDRERREPAGGVRRQCLERRTGPEECRHLRGAQPADCTAREADPGRHERPARAEADPDEPGGEHPGDHEHREFGDPEVRLAEGELLDESGQDRDPCRLGDDRQAERQSHEDGGHGPASRPSRCRRNGCRARLRSLGDD